MTSSRYSTEAHRRHTYGLDSPTYEALVTRQCSCCLVCGLRRPALVVDHDHRTGAIRGLLCGPCNRALGHLHDSPGVCRRAGEYLRQAQ